MISIEEGIVHKLKNTAGITAQVSTRIYPLVLPVSVTLPAITYQRIDTPREITHDQAAGGLAMPRFQFTAWGTFAEAKAIVKALRTALNGFRGTFGASANTVRVYGVLADNERDDYDPDSGLYWTTADYFLHHEE